MMVKLLRILRVRGGSSRKNVRVGRLAGYSPRARR